MYLFKDYHNKTNLFKTNEGWLKGNESKLIVAKQEFEIRKQEYLESLFSLNETLINFIRERKEKKEKEVREKFNMSIEEYLEFGAKKLEEKKALLESYRGRLADAGKKVDRLVDMIWTGINCLFVVGGMIGAFLSKFVMDILGRKKGIFFHNLFNIAAAILVIISYFVESPICLSVSRFLFGIQGGILS